jgi:hypothetical protein
MSDPGSTQVYLAAWTPGPDTLPVWIVTAARGFHWPISLVWAECTVERFVDMI